MMLNNLEKAIWTKESHKGKTLGEHIEECRRLLRYLMSFYNLPDYEEFAELLCYYHDLGKLKGDWDVNNSNNPPHSFFSALALFKKDREKLKKYPFLPLFILRHHSALTRIKDEDVWRVKEEAPESEKEQIDSELTNWRKDLYRLLSQLDLSSKVNLADTYGLFKFTDILSAESLENYTPRTPNKSIEELKIWLGEKVKKKGLQIKSDILETQLNLNKINANLLIRAPTGWGTTAASLSYAIGRDSKIVYVLPTITSIKSFYDDLCDFFGKENIGELFYYADVEIIKREESDFKELIFSSYFAQPVILTTLDQLLLTFLQIGKYYIKRPHLRNAVIILDEVHTFSQNMLYILSYFIEKLEFAKIYNLRLCLMSATFPNKLQEHFLNLVGEDAAKLWLDKEFRKKRRIMYKLFDGEADIASMVKNALKFGEPKERPFRIAVVCNTVEKSQEVFRQLLKTLNLKERRKYETIDYESPYFYSHHNGTPLYAELLHARYVYKHRSEKEERISSWLKNKENFILVATQVIEVSLDISFDFMITECAPLESLVQRFGRINRYNERTEEVNVWILFPTEINDKKGYPYDMEDIRATWEVLKGLEGENLKNEFQLIEEYEKVAFLSKTKQREIYNLLDKWKENTDLLFSWQVTDEHAQKLLKFRDEFTMLVIPSLYEGEVKKLYNQIKKETPYRDKRRIFARIKDYTVPVPIWMVFSKISSLEKGFPIAALFYDEIYGVRKEIDSII